MTLLNVKLTIDSSALLNLRVLGAESIESIEVEDERAIAGLIDDGKYVEARAYIERVRLETGDTSFLVYYSSLCQFMEA